MKILAHVRGTKHFSIFYETTNAEHNFLSSMKDFKWKIDYGFNAMPAKKVSQNEKSFLFDKMMMEFFKEHLLPKELIVQIHGVVGNMIRNFCVKYNYKILHKKHENGTNENPMDENLYILKWRSKKW